MMKCTGCSACDMACPVDCITMERNEKGFLRPVVDETKCIKCGLCDKVCVLKENHLKSLDEAEMYSAFSKDSIVRESTSSGGIGYCLAKNAFNHGYMVCGATLDYKEKKVKHIICKSKFDIEKLKGSKYLQSECLEAFKKIAYELKSNPDKKAMIFGTPCQIVGLDNVLKKKKLREQAILVDIFCHGVPSQLLWSQYISWLDKKHKIKWEDVKEIIFRDKKYSWHSYFMHIKTNQKEYVCSRETDYFLKLFSMGVLNQKECYTCKFRNSSAADIRLGDYWGKRYENSEEGFSMVLLQTEVGKEFFDNLDNIETLRVPIEERLGQQHEDYKTPKYWDKGFELLLNGKSLRKVIILHDPIHKAIWRNIKQKIKNILSR